MARKEFHSEDFPTTPLPEMDMPSPDDPMGRPAPDILVADADAIADNAKLEYLELLKFNEDLLTVYLYPTNKEFAPDTEPFWINNVGINVPVGKPCMVKRKYVEQMARAQPYSVRTSTVKPDSPAMPIMNHMHRQKSAAYAFTVLNDPSPRGAAWLEQVKREQ